MIQKLVLINNNAYSYRDIVNVLDELIYDNDFRNSINQSNEPKARDGSTQYYVVWKNEYFSVKFVYKSILKFKNKAYDNSVNSSTIKQALKNLDFEIIKLPYWWQIYAYYLYKKQSPCTIKEIKNNSFITKICKIKNTNKDKLSTRTDLMEYSSGANKVYKEKRRKNIIIFEQNKEKKWFINRNGIEYVRKNTEIFKHLEFLYNFTNTERRVTMTANIPLNQILYGPPGTGKTYSTVVKAMEILDNSLYKKYENKECNYTELKNAFDKLKTEKRIEFVTFHQSYSYEEFVEGIKPDIKDWEASDGTMNYSPNNGVFKEICDRARKVTNDNTVTKKPVDFSKARVFKMSLGNTLENEENIYKYCIENNVIALGYVDKDFSNYQNIEELKKDYDGIGTRQINTFRFWMEDWKNQDNIVVISNGNNAFRAIARIKGDYEYKPESDTGIPYSHFRKVEWLYTGEDIPVSKIYERKFSQAAAYELYNGDLKLDVLNDIITGKINEEEPLPHVLIIDEINRGEISKIFGELITLIEEDKRETLSVQLPYSHKNFTVPKMLYLIGTMNSSDHSVASIDIALRRRFRFVEIMPEPDLLISEQGEEWTVNSQTGDYKINLKKLMQIMNKRIAYLLDRDHQIGHSYFLKLIKDDEGNTLDAIFEENLKDVWFGEILPLLNEYFYCDWEMLQAVLSEAEKEEDNKTYSSFIKKIPIEHANFKFGKSNFDNFCFDFVSRQSIDFKTALENIYH